MGSPCWANDIIMFSAAHIAVLIFQKAKGSIENGVMLWLPQMREADKSEGAGLDPVEVMMLYLRCQ